MTYYSATAYSTVKAPLKTIKECFDVENAAFWRAMTDEEKHKATVEFQRTANWNLLHADVYPDAYKVLRTFLSNMREGLPESFKYSTPAMSGYEALTLSLLAYRKLRPWTNTVLLLSDSEEFTGVMQSIASQYNFVLSENKGQKGDDVLCFVSDNPKTHLLYGCGYNLHVHVPFDQKHLVHDGTTSVSIDATGVTLGNETSVVSSSKYWRNHVFEVTKGWCSGLYWSFNLGGSVGVNYMAANNVAFKKASLKKITCVSDYKTPVFFEMPGQWFTNWSFQVQSCGTESILKAIGMLAKHSGAKRVLSTEAAHVALMRAVELFALELVTVAMTEDYTICPLSLNALLQEGDIVFLSAPSYGFGTNDVTSEVVAVLQSYSSCLVHVDACLGGFFLNKEEQLRIESIATTISLDTHKYGQTPKGSSLLLVDDDWVERCFHFVVRGQTPRLSQTLAYHALKDADNRLETAVKEINALYQDIVSGITAYNLPFTPIGKEHSPNLALRVTDQALSTDKILQELETRGYVLGRTQLKKTKWCSPANEVFLHIVLTPLHVKDSRFASDFVRALLFASKQAKAPWFWLPSVKTVAYGANAKIGLSFLTQYMMKKRAEQLLD